MRAIALILTLATLLPSFSFAQEVNVYSSRKENLVKHLFENFTKETGVAVNFITDKPAKLIARMQSEGENTPADLFLTADVGNLGYAAELGLLQPINSTALDANIPAQYRDDNGRWYGLSGRVRAIFYAPDRVKNAPGRYEDLADEQWKNRILIRSSNNIYNQSLIASLIEANGLKDTEAWAAGLVANFARTPQGGDTDQLRALAAGEGDVAVANTYYYGRLLASDKPADVAVADKIAITFPNQADRGAHMNISGGGVVTGATNKREAVQLLEFLSGKEAQEDYATINHEFPLHPKAEVPELLQQWGAFKRDRLPLAAFVSHRDEVLKLTDRVDWR